MNEREVRDLVQDCGIDWHKGFMPLFEGDPTNRYEVLVEAVIAAERERWAAEAKAERKMMIPTSEIMRALIAYAGPLDDPHIGWLGRDASRNDLFKCERCGAEHEDCTKIEHKPGCSAADLLAVMQAIRA